MKKISFEEFQKKALDGNGVQNDAANVWVEVDGCLLYTSPSPRDRTRYRMPSSA